MISVQPGGKPVQGFEVPIQESIDRWTELTLEDGAVIRIKPMVLGVIRLHNQWDPEGNPLYAIKGGQNVTTIVRVPDHLRKPTGTTQGKAN
jgi:hypothetical protein